MKTASHPKTEISEENDLATPPLQHTGEQPFRRPPEDEPERVGEGELDIGKPSDELTARERAWEGEDDEEVVDPDVEDD
jgi:hypothetical protein